MSDWQGIKHRLAGKWQIPLLAVSLAALGGGLLCLRPTPDKLPLDRALRHLDVMVPGGLYDRAIELADAQLAVAGRTERDRAPLHLQLARALFGQAVRDRRRTAEVGRRVVEHFNQAVQHGQTLTAADLEHAGRAQEWQQDYAAAVEYYTKAVTAGVEAAPDLERHILTLRRTALGAPADEFKGRLEAFVRGLPDHRLDLHIWATEQRLRVLEALGEMAWAPTLLAREKARFSGSTFEDRFAYLEALVLYKTDHADDAEAHLRAIRNRVNRLDDVYARTGWLLGLAVLGERDPQRPEEAASFFRDVIRDHPDGAYGVASRIGLARALTMLERTDDAIEAYELALAGLRGLSDPYPTDLDVLRVQLGVASDGQRRLGNLKAAVAFADFAVRLADRDDVEQRSMYLEQLAESRVGYAVVLDDRPYDETDILSDDVSLPTRVFRTAAARDMARQAAATFLDIARINTLNERRASYTSWQAAELFGRAGDGDRAVALFEEFVRERPHDPRVPRAWLRIGSLWQALGESARAVQAYQQCYRQYPLTLDGSRALIPLARAYMESNPPDYDLAEKTLRIVLDDPKVFTPAAPEFAEALFLLGDILDRRGEVERAITVLEEALERYPDDRRVLRARFLLADAYRKSALALKQDAGQARIPGEIRYMRTEADRRFTRARELYRALIDALAPADPDATPDARGPARLTRMYLRLAQLYEADCLFDLRRYEDALKLYEEAAVTYRDTASALAAYLQIINCHVLLQRPQEARAALARAQILVDAIPTEAFERSVSPEGRADWKRHFKWLEHSGLFE